jgi:putative ABC transport system permease protein
LVSIFTRQNLLADKTRFVISMGGVAFSVFLISLLLSLYQGWSNNVGRFVERVDADIWVARDGTTDFLNAASILPATLEEELEAIPGVASADAVIVRPMSFETGGERADAHLVGYTAGAPGGPPSIERGVEAPGEGEIIVDEALEKKFGVGMDDTLVAGGEPLRVRAISSGGNFVFSSTAFVSLDQASSLLEMGDLRTFFLVTIDEGASSSDVATAIDDEFPGVSAFTSEEFAGETRDAVMDSVLPILVIILILAFIVGVALTGLTIYTATVEKSREFGILKAIGFTNRYLFRLVMEQSLVTGVAGFALGVAMTAVASRFASSAAPEFITLLRWQDVLLVLGTTLVMSVLGGILPVRRVAGVDPVTVFQA